MDNLKNPYIKKSKTLDNIPKNLLILPVNETCLFPKMVFPIVLQQKKHMELVDKSMAKNRLLGVLLSKKAVSYSKHSTKNLHTIGIASSILKMSKLDDGKLQLLLQGIRRFKVKRFTQSEHYIKARVEPLKSTNTTRSNENKNLMSTIVEKYEQIVKMSASIPSEINHMIKSLQKPNVFADMVASTINISTKDKQRVLEELDVTKRLQKIISLVNDQVDILEMRSNVENKAKQEIHKKQKEYYLRQQLKIIKSQLGEDNENIQIQEYKVKINNKTLPQHVKKTSQKELERLAKMHPSSSEYIVSFTYLDWLISLPWENKSEDNLNIEKAEKILNNDHYGLEKPKKRILEYLAIRNLKQNIKGPILCFTGPPGTGKTSLGKSVAKALHRKFVRISLGGIRDEAEIRGHRRTYVGAMPGRIIQSLRKIGTNNPIFMLDEIDKLSASYQGNPSSSLLEVLDPEQNNSFSDHYLNLDFDLSNVMFLATANVLHTIPAPLLDRLEVLNLSGYTQEEKVKIATRYLIPKQRIANGLKASQIKFTIGAIKQIISDYTKEAGLRNLERQIGAICRSVATQIVQNKGNSFIIGHETLSKYLGNQIYKRNLTFGLNKPGVASGLAWTLHGGEILFIEAVIMEKGKGKLLLTGQLGDVMKESAKTALSFARVNFKKDSYFFTTNDFHIHVPEGTIPKDGPSAGLAILISIVSLIKQKSVKGSIAMSGEITLRGDLLPVGGIKEKVIAAYRAGIKTILLPSWNKKDMNDVPDDIKNSITFIFIDKMEEALEVVFEK